MNVIIRLSILFMICLVSCTEPFSSVSSPDVGLELYMNNQYDEECGCYIVEYPTDSESHYTAVEYNTEPITRVFWDSDDYYTFIYWGRETSYPIITNSTYSDEYGDGRQLIYLYKDFIGDTLSVYGCVSDECESLTFVIKGT